MAEALRYLFGLPHLMDATLQSEEFKQQVDL